MQSQILFFGMSLRWGIDSSTMMSKLIYKINDFTKKNIMFLDYFFFPECKRGLEMQLHAYFNMEIA